MHAFVLRNPLLLLSGEREYLRKAPPWHLGEEKCQLTIQSLSHNPVIWLVCFNQQYFQSTPSRRAMVPE